ncbi:MAG: nicotinate-nucleotide pyrophosphorylase [Fibrobacteres bacterium]|nr:nicotinate-nucleotide pyrophosphorylase [Fibrobacterota bacterium]
MPATTANSLPAFPSEAFDRLLPWAFSEDEGHGDITSIATIEESAVGRAHLLCKQSGVIAGLPLVERVFRHRGFHPSIELRCAEGADVESGDVLMTLHGSMQAMLVCERILLNFLQRLSGIATVAREYARALEGGNTRILDTRKTMPGYRALDKYAVAVGGGTNHRMGLYDMVLIKDNHAEACGSVRAAVDKVLARYAGTYTVEAEVRTLDELRSLLDSSVDIILLDNMDDETLREAVDIARAGAPRIKLEASGNMDLARAKRIREFGLDFISVGALTHSVKALDISLDILGEGRK